MDVLTDKRGAVVGTSLASIAIESPDGRRYTLVREVELVTIRGVSTWIPTHVEWGDVSKEQFYKDVEVPDELPRQFDEPSHEYFVQEGKLRRVSDGKIFSSGKWKAKDVLLK